LSTHTFRITVRGFFDALTQAQRSELLAEADQHDILRTAHTPTGHLSYDLSAREAFAFRFLDTGEEEDDVTAATRRAETAAANWLDDRGYGFKNLRSQAVDLATAPLSKRQRQAAVRGRAAEVRA
jgi:hypothetical protein